MLRFCRMKSTARADVLYGGLTAHDRAVVFRLGAHFRRPGRLAVAAQVEQPDVVAARGDVFHPGQAIELEVEGGLRRIGRAVDIEHGLLGPEARHVGRPLVADVDLDAGIAGLDHHLLGHELRRLRQCRSCEDGGKQESHCHSKLLQLRLPIFCLVVAGSYTAAGPLSRDVSCPSRFFILSRAARKRARASSDQISAGL